jgi:hypothetical protein
MIAFRIFQRGFIQIFLRAGNPLGTVMWNYHLPDVRSVPVPEVDIGQPIALVVAYFRLDLDGSLACARERRRRRTLDLIDSSTEILRPFGGERRAGLQSSNRRVAHAT